MPLRKLFSLRPPTNGERARLQDELLIVEAKIASWPRLDPDVTVDEAGPGELYEERAWLEKRLQRAF